MTLYFPYGLLAIGMSMYIFYRTRQKSKMAAKERRTLLKAARQQWLDGKLGRKSADIVLYGKYMEEKLKHLTLFGRAESGHDVYYWDVDTGDKWILEYPDPKKLPGGDWDHREAQLRKLKQFPDMGQ